jgi:hypothetical protein
VRPTRVVLLCSAVACLVAGRLPGQSLATAQVGLVQPSAGPVVVRTPTIVNLRAAGDRPRRWPYVVGGAVVGGAVGGVWLAHRAARTDDAMVFPIYGVGAVAAGAALGALGGLIVSVVVHPSAR